MTVVAQSIIDELKSSGELRVEDFFSEERISVIKKQIEDVYEPGIGISGKVLGEIMYGYQQELRKYEGSAYHFLGLVVTRDLNRKSSPIFLVRKEEIGSTLFPVAPSKWHDLDKIENVKKSINEVWESGVSSSDYSESSVRELISTYCSEIANIVNKIGSILKLSK